MSIVMVSVLIGVAAVLAAYGARGQTPLHFASTVEIAEYLLDQGAQIDTRDIQHESSPAQHMIRVVQARYFPRDQMGLSTQCGFGTVWGGNPIPESVQETKLRLVAEIAHRAWG